MSVNLHRLLRLTCFNVAGHTNKSFFGQFLHGKSVPSSRVCYSSSATRTKKVFQPAFGNSEFAKVEEEEVAKRESENAKSERRSLPRTRKLSKLDKFILVKLGKYKSIADVPDQVTGTKLRNRPEVREEVRNRVLGSAFKYIYLFEYASFVITFSVLGIALYWYRKTSNESNVEKKGSPSEDSLSESGNV